MGAGGGGREPPTSAVGVGTPLSAVSCCGPAGMQDGSEASGVGSTGAWRVSRSGREGVLRGAVPSPVPFSPISVCCAWRSDGICCLLTVSESFLKCKKTDACCGCRRSRGRSAPSATSTATRCPARCSLLLLMRCRGLRPCRMTGSRKPAKRRVENGGRFLIPSCCAGDRPPPVGAGRDAP